METQMNAPKPSVSRPHADAPVPAGDHYDIVKFAEEKIMRHLERPEAEGDSEEFLVGLEVGYIHILPDGKEGQNYSMSFGYVEEAEEDTDGEIVDFPSPEQPAHDALNDTFIQKLFNEVSDKIIDTAPKNSGDYLVRLQITTGHCSTITKTCWGAQCVNCGKHGVRHTQVRRTTLTGGCVWRCTTNPCRI